MRIGLICLMLSTGMVMAQQEGDYVTVAIPDTLPAAKKVALRNFICTIRFQDQTNSVENIAELNREISDGFCSVADTNITYYVWSERWEKLNMGITSNKIQIAVAKIRDNGGVVHLGRKSRRWACLLLHGVQWKKEQAGP